MYLTSPFQFTIFQTVYIFIHGSITQQNRHVCHICIYIKNSHLLNTLYMDLKKHVSLIPLSIKHETLNLA